MDLVNIKTEDGLELEGGLFGQGRKGIIFVHGVANNFYRTPLWSLAKLLGDRGYKALCANNRGHDWITRSVEGKRLWGAAFELFEDSVLDIDAFLSFMRDEGCDALALIGHSLGACKVIHYQAKKRRPEVRALVSCSCADMTYSRRHEKFEGFDEVFADAQWMLSEKRAEEVFRLKRRDGTFDFYTARTLVDKYGPEDRANALKYVGRIECPILFLAGTKEPRMERLARELYASCQSHRKELLIIEGADHYYVGYEERIAKAIDAWLSELL